MKSTQLRKDLTYFGQFGTRGLGYNVKALSGVLNEVLGTTSYQPVILVGVGNLGSALLQYKGFNKEGFEIAAAFDLAPTRERRTEGAIDTARGMDEEAIALRQQLDDKLDEVRRQATADRDKSRSQHKRLEGEMMAATRKKVDEKLSTGMGEVNAEVSRIRGTLEQQRSALAAEIASRVLGRAVKPEGSQ